MFPTPMPRPLSNPVRCPPRWGVGVVAMALLAAPLLVRSICAAPAASYEVTVLQIWGDDAEAKETPAKELQPFLKKLQKRSKKKSFRLHGAVVKKTLKAGEEHELKLPSGYVAKWKVETEGKTISLQQVLTNPKKKQSTVRLRKSPVISGLEKIRDGSSSFLLLVTFKKSGSVR